MAVAMKKKVLAECKKFRTQRTKLVAKRNEIEKEIKRVEKSISKSRKSVAARPVGRPKKNKRGPKVGSTRVENKYPLAQFIERVMKPGVGMSAIEVHDKLLKAGYKTDTKIDQNFRSVIGSKFRTSKSIKRVEHGKYVFTPSLTKKNSKSAKGKTKRLVSVK
ncbi:MAG: hypothetical protein J7L15_08210 [Clostridiales bacterium]|nr:hypothetical protein [Clostridiales bacterium]